MFIAVVLQKQANVTKGQESVAYSVIGESAEDAAATAESYADSLRKVTGYRYRTLTGEITQEVTPPEKKVVLVPYKEKK